MSYTVDGYEVIPRAVSDNHCDLLNRAALYYQNMPHVPMAHQKIMFVHATTRLPRLAEMAKECVGGRPAMVSTEYFFGKPGTRGFNPHQDNHFLQTPEGAMVSCWVALTDVDTDNGCLQVYPATHKLGLLAIARQDPDNRVDQCMTPSLDPVDVPMRKGDAIFMHGELIHGSRTNESDRRRESLTIGYIRSGVPFRAGKYGRVEVPV